MRTTRRSQPAPEALEARAAPVGFYTGPSPAPKTIFLDGILPASAAVQPAISGSGETIHVSGSGRIRPLGRTTLAGTLRIGGDLVSGTLSLHAARSNLVLKIGGESAQVSSSPSPLRFEIVQGRGTPPGNFAYLLEEGSGSVRVTLPSAPAPGRFPIVFTFQSP